MLELRCDGRVPLLRVLQERAARRPRRRLLPNIWPVSSSGNLEPLNYVAAADSVLIGLLRIMGLMLNDAMPSQFKSLFAD